MDVGGAGRGAISSINVTPMADVIIVLLIIFMVTVPKIARRVDLPDAVRGRERAAGAIVVTVLRDGSITLSGHGPVTLSDLTAQVSEQLANTDAGVTLDADQGLAYERVSEVLFACRAAGAESISLMTEPRTPSLAGATR
jgi:biopolymer transport protein TolR